MNNLCACAKDEYLYLHDWFEWYRNLGFNVFHIADNGGNGSPFSGVNFYDYKDKHAIQIPFYQTITDYLSNGDWCLYCDIDEFLNLDIGSIDKFISQVPTNVDCVLFNWKCYGDNGLDKFEDKPVWERFTIPAPINCVYNSDLPMNITENMHVKALVRKTNKRIFWNNVHCPIIENGVYCDSSFKQVNPYFWKQINWDNGYIAHYISKSAEEFCNRRLNKEQDATGGHISNDKCIRYYTNLNGRSPI